MPQNDPFWNHEQHGGILLRKGLVAAIREAAAPPTPAPAWKLYENPSYQRARAAAMASATLLMDHREEDEEGDNDEADKQQPERREDDEKREYFEADKLEREGRSVTLREIGGFEGVQEHIASRISFMSARKLAASLWDEFREDGEGDSPVAICNLLESSPCSHLQPQPSSLSNSESPDSLYHQNSWKMPPRSHCESISSAPLYSPSPPLKAISLTSGSSTTCKTANLCFNLLRKESFEEQHGHSPEKNTKEDVGYSAPLLDYTKASSRLSLENTQQDDSLSELTFCEELRRALSRVEQVEAAQISARKEVDSLLRRCAVEITLLRTKEQERIQAAVSSAAEELNLERAARKTAEVESKKLFNSVTDANRAVVAAEQELEKERKARQLMEDVCNELAKEIAEDKTEVEELKKELAKARGEVEEERKVLRVTEAWREERVQMKFSEAKLELEERCIALDRLKVELESFLSKHLVHRTGRRGRSLKRAIRRLQDDTCESAFFQDGKFQLSPTDDALHSSISSSRPNRSYNTGYSSVFRRIHNRHNKKQVFHFAESAGSDLDWNGGFHRERLNLLEFTNAQLKQERVHFLGQMSNRRRNAASMRSYQSKTKGLSSLGAIDYGQGTSNHSVKNRAGIYGGRRNRGDSTSEGTYGDLDEGHESIDDIGDKRDSQILVRSANAEKQDPSTSEAEEICTITGGHGSARMKQQHRGQCAARAKRYYGPSYKCSRRGDHILATENESQLSSITGYSSAFKGHMPSPDFPRKENVHVRSFSNQITSLARRAVYSSVDWSKSYKENSLQAKLLQEDKLFR